MSLSKAKNVLSAQYKQFNYLTLVFVSYNKTLSGGMYRSSGLLHVALWELEFGEQVKNAGPLANSIAMNNKQSFVSDSEDLCFLVSTKL